MYTNYRSTTSLVRSFEQLYADEHQPGILTSLSCKFNDKRYHELDVHHSKMAAVFLAFQ